MTRKLIIYEEVLREFQRRRVRYVLVGGIALNLHGSLRTTADLDLLVEMSDENLAKIVRILKRQGYRVKQPVDPMGIARRETREDWIRNKHMKAFNFYKDTGLKEVDLLIDSPVSYEKAKNRVVPMRVGDLTIPVAAIDDLVQMKRNTGREVDQRDVRELRLIKELKRWKRD